jgi:hypothetical protein
MTMESSSSNSGDGNSPDPIEGPGPNWSRSKLARTGASAYLPPDDHVEELTDLLAATTDEIAMLRATVEDLEKVVQALRTENSTLRQRAIAPKEEARAIAPKEQARAIAPKEQVRAIAPKAQQTQVEATQKGPHRDGQLERRQAQLTHAMKVLALRWQGEIVGEKACILIAGLIAYLKFEDFVATAGGGGVGGEGRRVGVYDVVVLTCMLYIIEAVTDFAFVLLMEMRWSMPIVTATAEVQNKGRWLWFKSIVGLSFVLNGMTACIGMATSIAV